MSGESTRKSQGQRSASWFLRILAPPLVLIGGVAGLVVLASSHRPPQPVDVDVEAPLVETTTVSLSRDVVDIQADGVVVPFRSITIAAEVSGRIVEKSKQARAGRMVSQGDLLVRIDPASFQLAVARLQSQRDQAKAGLRELAVKVENAAASIAVAQDQLKLRQAEVSRIENLQDRGVSTQQALDSARLEALASRKGLVTLQNDKRLLEAQAARLKEEIELSEVRLAEAKLDLEHTKIHAPVTGVVVSCDVETGSYVAVGDPIAEIDDTSAVEVETNLEMRTLAWLRANAKKSPEYLRTPAADESVEAYCLPPVPVTVLYEVLGNVYAWSGVLDRVDGVGLDERTRTVPCRVLVKKPRAVSQKSGSTALPVAGPAALVRGMYVKLVFHSTPIEPLLCIPQVAVQPDNSVWAVRKGTLEKFPLLGSRVIRGNVLVAPAVTGLRPGEAVVVSPLPFGREGLKVRMAEPTNAFPNVASRRGLSLETRKGNGDRSPTDTSDDISDREDTQR